MHEQSAAWITLLLLLIGQSPQEIPKAKGGKSALTTISEMYMDRGGADETCSLPATFFMGADRLRASSFYVVPQELSLREGEIYEMENLLIVLFDTEGEVIRCAPMRLQFEDQDPRVISLEDLESERHSLRAIHAGTAKLKLTSLVPRADGTYPSAMLSVSVRPREPNPP